MRKIRKIGENQKNLLKTRFIQRKSSYFNTKLEKQFSSTNNNNIY